MLRNESLRIFWMVAAALRLPVRRCAANLLANDPQYMSHLTHTATIGLRTGLRHENSVYSVGAGAQCSQ